MSSCKRRKVSFIIICHDGLIGLPNHFISISCVVQLHTFSVHHSRISEDGFKLWPDGIRLYDGSMLQDYPRAACLFEKKCENSINPNEGKKSSLHDVVTMSGDFGFV